MAYNKLAEESLKEFREHMKMKPLYGNLKYFELRPTSTNKKIRISMNDSIGSINRKLKGIVNRKVELFSNLGKERHRVKAIKTDIQKKIGLVERLWMRDKYIWSGFSGYRYAAIQIPGHHGIDMLAITDIDDSVAVTDKGERIPIRSLCVDTKLFGLDVGKGAYECMEHSRLLENTYIYLIDKSVCFIKYKPGNNEYNTEIAKQLNDLNLFCVLGINTVSEWR